jgi:hypothetical protein
VSLFADWASELTNALVDLGPELVVADGWQFYNVAHDLTHLMARLAVERAGRQLGRNIELVEFDVAPRNLGEMPPQGPEAFRVELDDVAFLRKQTQANRPEIREEFTNLVAFEGLPAQRTEVFRKPLELGTIMSSAPVARNAWLPASIASAFAGMIMCGWSWMPFEGCSYYPGAEKCGLSSSTRQ